MGGVIGATEGEVTGNAFSTAGTGQQWGIGSDWTLGYVPSNRGTEPDGVVGGGTGYDDLMLCAVFSKIAYDDINTASLRGTVSSYAVNRTDRIWSNKTVTFGEWFTDVAGDWNIMGRVSFPSGFYVVTFMSPDNNRMIIAFRGTNELVDWTGANIPMLLAERTEQFNVSAK